MNKILTGLALLTLSANAIAEENVYVQLCETINTSVPQLTSLYAQGKYPSELKKLLNHGYAKGFPGLSPEALSIIIVISNEIVTRSWLMYEEGYPDSVIQKYITKNVCTPLGGVTS